MSPLAYCARCKPGDNDPAKGVCNACMTELQGPGFEDLLKLWQEHHRVAALAASLKGGTMNPQEVGVGSRLRRWSCKCTTHMIKGVVKHGPYSFRGAATVEYSVFCQFCDSIFTLEPEAPAKKRRTKLCGVHCPEGSHTHP